MKKFFTLACAAVMALSASAITPAKLQPKQVENFDALKLEMPTVEKLAPVKHARPARNLKAAAAPAKKVAAATQDYTPAAPIEAMAFSWESEYEDGSWTIQFYGGADTSYVGKLELYGPSTANSIAGTYTVDLASYCYVEFVRAAGDTLISLVDGETFTITYVSEAEVAGELLTTYHVSGDLTDAYNSETIHMDFDFTVAGGADYIWWYAWFVNASEVSGGKITAPLVAYCEQLGLYCQYEENVWITLMDKPVDVTGDTIAFYNPHLLMPEFKYFASAGGVNRVIFRGNEAVLANGDTLGVFGAFFFTADSLEEGTFDLLDQESAIVNYNHVTVWAKGDTTDFYINTNEPSSVTVSKSADGLATYFDFYMAARDGNVYTTSAVYYMPTVATDSMAFAFQYDRTEGWSMPGADVDTTWFESDGDYMFGAYGLVLDTLGYIQDAYWLSLDVILTDESAVGTYTINDVYMDYCELYNAWFGYGLNILDLNFEIIDTDMDTYGDWIEGEVYASDGLIHPFVMPFVHPLAPTPTAIENNEAEIKATKSLKNGQLVIEKNGLKYNVLGASLK